MKMLTDNFSLEELTHSITALNKGIDNTPDAMATACLRMLAVKVLQPAREYLGQPISISSGYRSPKLNKIIGGAKYSQHVKGEAADIICADNAVIFDFIRNNLDFDQLIWEFGDENQPAWIHVSYSPGSNRREVLKALKKGRKTVYELY